MTKSYVYKKPNYILGPQEDDDELPPEAPTHDIDIAHLSSQALEILRREIKNLMSESVTGKLAPNSARDLVNYVKLLSDMQAKEKELIDDLSEEEMEKLLKETAK